MGVPVIDFSKIDGPERSEVLAQIANGCQEWGFFQLVNHGISEELLERVKKVCSDCYKVREEGFKDSLPVRLLNKVLDDDDDRRQYGNQYYLEGDEAAAAQATQLRLQQLKNNVDWEDVFTLHDDNQWPTKAPPQFKETMMQYRKEVKKLAEKMLEIMDTNLGLEKGYIKKAFCGGKEELQVQQPFFGTKVSHYPPCPNPELVNGLRAHTDAGGLILLFQDDAVGGLQMLNKEGEWIDVQPLRNAIVINTGDQLEVISNGRYKSAWHRVLAMPTANRRSIASFYNPSLDATIKPAPDLVRVPAPAPVRDDDDDDDGSDNIGGDRAYPEFLFGDYMKIYSDHKFQPKEPRFQAAGSFYKRIL
ncbi:hypothetical protein H6P81_003445 [Aristolochia fimbriata]|uniref:aminocyclopropanecarboxylate oxidase n=1 Tax=Aristolochia fimbriata TaxID=158543 RepID=A0AAV7FFW8_ARIFI|nr:hypothetical protein H6P81_003445 [Aristolochia fimbriata]